ncbi:metal-dependent transcriptional regulator [Halobacterium yunchengense]|uniref:metal-dependent transcriptional regulator n=1 Tax=Halobacterium yunchengense TaxID=3108497 RepID=UPI00300A5C00
MSGDDLSETAGRYLSAILVVSAREGRRARTGELADRLGVDPATVTERLASFADRELVDYERYEGATLTDAGERVTRERMWKRCLVENFAGDELGLEDVDSETVGGVLSEETALALKRHIDHPCTGRCSAPNADFEECCPDYQA